ncbi:denticleless protein homolog [Ceraceosorus bombacis]|uniref:Denticleless protein homolog n=1 Tax=Ceraceosorus bombacis TaxID=401625 RepID=A0A0P1BJU2_9BASI|nr:denticleless protein homolog [Ceraceosorus bombacis]
MHHDDRASSSQPRCESSSQASPNKRRYPDLLDSSPALATPSTSATSHRASSSSACSPLLNSSKPTIARNALLPNVGRSLFGFGSSPISFLQASPAASRRDRVQVRDDGGNRANENAIATARTPPPARTSAFIVKGTVTPSRAARFFLPVHANMRRSAEAVSNTTDASPARTAARTSGRRGTKRSRRTDDSAHNTPHALSSTSMSRRCPTLDTLSDSDSSSDRDDDPFCSSPLRKVARQNPFRVASPNASIQLPCALRALSIQRDVGSAWMSMRSAMPRCAIFAAGRGVVPRTSYLDSFAPKAHFCLDPITEDAGPELPLCGSFSYSARFPSGNESRWLASGTNSGNLVLVDCADTSGQRQLVWNAHRGSTFDLAWRDDDRRILSGGSDYFVKIWDAETGLCTGTFAGHSGSPRSVAWDPTSASGSLFSSAGRDGSVLVYDDRVHESGSADATQPVLRIDCAHPSAVSMRGKRAARGTSTAAKGVMSLVYLPTRGQHAIASAGCADGVVKMWDLRHVGEECAAVDFDASSRGALADVTNLAKSSGARGKKRSRAAERKDGETRPCASSVDVSARQHGCVKSSHGISSLVASDTDLFAASTDGNIHALSIAGLANSAISTMGITSFAHPSHKGNTLYARLALAPDQQTLALGCRNGDATLWDIKAAMAEPNARPAVLRSPLSNAEINAVAFTSDSEHGTTLATLADDFIVRLWAPTT